MKYAGAYSHRFATEYMLISVITINTQSGVTCKKCLVNLQYFANAAKLNQIIDLNREWLDPVSTRGMLYQRVPPITGKKN